MKNRMAVVLLCVSVLLLTGCSKKNVDYDIGDTQSTRNGAQAEGDSTLAQFADAESWEESWKATNAEGETYDITISADISTPAVNQMSVVEVKEVEMGEMYRKQILEGLFPEGMVYYNDTEHWPKNRLRQRIEELEEEQELLEEEKENYAEAIYRESFQELDDEIKKYTNLLESAPSDYQQAKDYSDSSYRIEQEGMVYTISFEEYDYVFRNEWAQMGPEDSKALCPEALKEKEWLWYEGKESTEENQCSLTPQEAQAMAERALSEMNLTDYVYEETLPIVWGGNITGDDGMGIENENATDGWEISYGIGIDGVSFRQFGTENSYLWETMEEMLADKNVFYSMDAGITLSVMDEGVIDMSLMNPVEITSVTKDVELLPLESIQTIMRNELTENIDDYPYLEKNNYYTDMELIYFRIRDREKKDYYSYVPVWRLSVQFADSQGHETIERPVLVNAIDGSVIHMQDEFCGAAE